MGSTVLGLAAAADRIEEILTRALKDNSKIRTHQPQGIARFGSQRPMCRHRL
jgi:hypothetical protein